MKKMANDRREVTNQARRYGKQREVQEKVPSVEKRMTRRANPKRNETSILHSSLASFTLNSPSSSYHCSMPKRKQSTARLV